MGGSTSSSSHSGAAGTPQKRILLICLFFSPWLQWCSKDRQLNSWCQMIPEEWSNGATAVFSLGLHGKALLALFACGNLMDTGSSCSAANENPQLGKTESRHSPSRIQDSWQHCVEVFLSVWTETIEVSHGPSEHFTIAGSCDKVCGESLASLAGRPSPSLHSQGSWEPPSPTWGFSPPVCYRAIRCTGDNFDKVLIWKFYNSTEINVAPFSEMIVADHPGDTRNAGKQWFSQQRLEE